MRNSNFLPDSVMESVVESNTRHKRFAQVGTDILEQKDDGVLIVRVSQTSNIGRVYTAEELHTFGKEIFAIALESGVKVNWRPVVWKNGVTDHVDVSWIKARIDEFGIKQNDIARDLGLTKEVVSRVLSGKYALTNWHRAALHYYFECLRLKGTEGKAAYHIRVSPKNPVRINH